MESLKYPTDQFSYKYLIGPVLTEEELNIPFEEGNCRFALQLYFYRIHNKFFERDQIYLPGGYKVWGNFIFKEEEINPTKLKPGDVIYAQNIRNKDDKDVDKKKFEGKTYDEYRIAKNNFLGPQGHSWEEREKGILKRSGQLSE